MGMRMWAAAAAMLCASQANAATHVVDFTGVFIPPSYPNPISTVIDGVTATGDDYGSPMFGGVADHGGGGGFFAQQAITFTTGSLFTPVDVHLSTYFTYVMYGPDGPPCYDCVMPYQNLNIRGMRNGVILAEDTINSADFPVYSFAPKFSGVDSLILMALAPLDFVSGVCFDNACSVSRIDELRLVDVTSAVPEPSTWAMMLIGLVGLTLRRRSLLLKQAG